jgi:hypothetical protein
MKRKDEIIKSSEGDRLNTGIKYMHVENEQTYNRKQKHKATSVNNQIVNETDDPCLQLKLPSIFTPDKCMLHTSRTKTND